MVDGPKKSSPHSPSKKFASSSRSILPNGTDSHREEEHVDDEDDCWTTISGDRSRSDDDDVIIAIIMGSVLRGDTALRGLVTCSVPEEGSDECGRAIWGVGTRDDVTVGPVGVLFCDRW